MEEMQGDLILIKVIKTMNESYIINKIVWLAYL